MELLNEFWNWWIVKSWIKACIVGGPMANRLYQQCSIRKVVSYYKLSLAEGYESRILV